jgi:hypothetical protein
LEEAKASPVREGEGERAGEKGEEEKGVEGEAVAIEGESRLEAGQLRRRSQCV